MFIVVRSHANPCRRPQTNATKSVSSCQLHLRTNALRNILGSRSRAITAAAAFDENDEDEDEDDEDELFDTAETLLE